MKKIFETVSGSRLYGTSVETSDTDIKGIYVPSRESILLQRSEKLVHERTSEIGMVYEREIIPLATFMNSLAKADTRVIDMFFAPRSMWLMEPDPIFFRLFELRHSIISRECRSMISYSRNFAAKYGAHSSMLRALDGVLNMLSRMDPNEILDSHIFEISDWSTKNADPWWELTDKSITVSKVSVPFTRTVGEAMSTFYNAKRSNEWRVKRHVSEINDIDWKDMMHGIRIADQAIELMETGIILFPRHNADHLLRIRNGEVSIQEIGTWIDAAIMRIERLALTSRILAAERDQKLIDDMIVKIYAEAVNE